MKTARQQVSRNIFSIRGNNRNLNDNESFPSTKPDFFKTIDSFQIKKYDLNSTKILKGGK